ncbi:MAG: DNA repair protein RadA [Alphaproteobacteria bacterium]
MARGNSFVCQACGTAHRKWVGQCEGCGAWNTVVEEIAEAPAPGTGKAPRKAHRVALESLAGGAPPPPRRPTGLAELDRVLGGGFVAGSAVLLGGDPGIGKSTLALQAAAAIARQGALAVYLSGEESVEQVRLRARRLGLGDTAVAVAAATNVTDIVATLEGTSDVALVVVDSIQTVYHERIEAAPGTVGQIRVAAYELIRFAKRRGAVVALVGHVTKEGLIAGPKVLEHMVDTVLYFEGDRGHQFRILRAVKNRFGATDEIGVFEMSDRGLLEVANPSSLFLGQRDENATGSAVFAGMEGSRPVLVEIQALVAASPLATPRRAVVGWDSGRLAMILAVLDARCGLALGGNDVYLNVAGGLRIVEPAADLAVAAALVSSLVDVPVPKGTVVFGEVGLSGEVRPVSQMEARLKEAAKLGFCRALMPVSSGERDRGDEIAVTAIGRLGDMVAELAPTRTGRGPR